MRRLPSRLPQPTIDLIRWADSSDASPLAADRVPGAEGPELSRLAALGALARALAPAAVDDWPEPLAAWARDAEVCVGDTVARAVRNSIDAVDYDIFAIAYEHIVSGVNRRRLGTFFTPTAIVNYMITKSQLLLSGSPRHIVDPGAGVGAFTLAALSAWRTAKVTAVDVNVVTLGLLATRAAVNAERGGPAARRLNLAPVDYLGWVHEQWPRLDGSKLILGNPPYTRHQHMTEKEKRLARAAAGDLITSGLAGLSAYFLAATLKMLASNDAVCFLLPASWCETRYGREIRQWLWDAQRRHVEIGFFPSEVEVFRGTQVTAMVLLVGPTKDANQPFIAREIDLPSDGLQGSVTEVRAIYADRTASCPATFTRILRRPTQASARSVISLGDVARIRRGVATGASEYFFITDAQREEHKLPDRVLRRALVRPGHCTGICFDTRIHALLLSSGLPSWLFDLNESESPETDAHIAAYLARGRELGIDARFLTSHRPLWYVVEDVKAPDLFLVPVGKPYHRVIINDAGAVGSNNFYGIYLNESAPWHVEALASWLRSRDGVQRLADLARHYHGGSLKIEPKSLQTLKVPVDLELDESEAEPAFDDLDTVISFSHGGEEPRRGSV